MKKNMKTRQFLVNIFTFIVGISAILAIFYYKTDIFLTILFGVSGVSCIAGVAKNLGIIKRNILEE